MADFLLRFFLAEDMRAAVPGAGLDTKTYAAVVAQRTIYVILILNNMQEEPQWRITAPSMHGHRRIRRKEEPLHCGVVICGQRGSCRCISGTGACGQPHARHNVYAYRLREGNRERYSDDGEPAKTAGTPALEVLQHSGLTDLIVVVTRYFGGVLLGTGGLVRAYTTATARALENAEVVTVRSVVELSVTVDYSLYERASLLIDAAGAKQAAPQFTDRVTLCWQMPEHTEGPLLEQLRELTRGSAQVTVSDPFYAPF